MAEARLTSSPSQVSPPAVSVDARLPHAVPGADVVALPVLPAGEPDGAPLLGPGAQQLGELLGLDLVGVLESARATAAAGEVTSLPVPAGVPDAPDLRCVLLVGLGSGTRDDFRRAGAATARAAMDRATLATTVPAVDPELGLEAFVVGAILGSFGFSWRSTPPEHLPVGRVVLAELAEADAPAVQRASASGGAAWRSRTLAWMPANLKTPDWLAQQAVTMAHESGLEVSVWDEARLAAEGFGALVAVGQASPNPPRLIRLDYVPRGATRAERRRPPVVLVGKGITFDTGGISIKPGESMTNMKRDMTGGGAVIATMAALDAVGCPVPVIGLVAAAENSVSGNSLRPGDVIRHRGGRTTEVSNTDAEGRLVMADALAYAVAELDPAVVVDIATLTGAIRVALGQQVGGLFANDDALADALAAAGTASGEPVWRMPLAGAYEDKISSRIADSDNAGGGPGAIIAGLFLQHFVGDVPWAHLDIASTGDSPEDRFEWSKGPTGFGARLLLEWLGGPDPLAGIGKGSKR
ncbi:leucyl aminopeptidase family protein [Nocardioides dilutus]